MKQSILTIFTRTPLHVGAGSSVGAIDQPVIRERHTRFPVIPGSSIKGVLRDEMHDEADVLRDVFGEQDFAGRLSFGEARLLAFPVRSAKGAFAFAVSPITLQRFARDAGIDLAIPSHIADMTCLAGEQIVYDGKSVVLEEYCFSKAGDFPKEWSAKLSGLLADAVLAGSAERFVLISDADLTHFAQNACQVSQHVRIDDETGTADGGGLFNEETVPSETLFYAPLGITHDNPNVHTFLEKFKTESLIQFGGKGTTGLGYCTVKIID
ncbi:MAG: type III-B CRISPR module RAMP protein Cmr4 [Kiritimatiellae bacterium]|jgi:CRISPR-associated protein Cmr4|nr:type III-B CRISPR module RAMP protein Cmr4 [Kiritimatiellia bacterium]MDD3584118.1 type III-B CRISPR module RAMP protein Cmr4 [Kiritimatiellia bacterium]HHU15977.1 type III-B CRISPR module RAMP protein Cmr4 [Lentisphaerota bacterium]HON46385.1 type III-B CRISPR module RAMP protein Cmr4 [Kiritimatiellia bacterium]